MMKLIFLFISLLLYKYIKLEISFIIPSNDHKTNKLSIGLKFIEIKNKEKSSEIITIPICLNEYSTFIFKSELKNANDYLDEAIHAIGKLKNSTLSGYMGKAIISLNDDNFQWGKFPFIFIDKVIKGNYSDGNCFGLRRDGFTMSYLYNTYNIKNFAINYSKKKIIFGGNYIQWILRDERNISKCDIDAHFPNKNRNDWRCKLDYVIINKKVEHKRNAKGEMVKIFYEEENVVFNNTYNMRFDSNFPYFKAPKRFLDFLKDKYIPHHLCQYDNFYYSKFFICSGNLKQYFLPITFVLNEYDITFEFEDLLMTYEDLYLFKVLENKEEDIFVFGQVFFNKYLSIFDIKENNIKFYSKSEAKKVNIISHSNSKDNNTISFIIIFNILICGINSTFLLIVTKYTFSKSSH